jgi:hypothetical protein
MAAVLAGLITARQIQAGDLARQVGCTASHLSHNVHRHTRPSAALTARPDAALGGGQVASALARTPVARLRRSGAGPARSPR